MSDRELTFEDLLQAGEEEAETEETALLKQTAVALFRAGMERAGLRISVAERDLLLAGFRKHRQRIARQNAEAGRKGGSMRTAQADATRDAVHELARWYRDRFPHDAELKDGKKFSQRMLSRVIAIDLGVPSETVRKHLRALRIR